MIRLEEIIKRYSTVEALKGVNLISNPGEILALVGPSGCGKTTVLRVIAGFEKPDKGTVFIEDAPVSTPSRMKAPHQRGLSMIFQDLALWPHMTVRQHISFVLDKKMFPGTDNNKQVLSILREVNLPDCSHRYPDQLSGGEKQRLAIARAIAPEPAYLLMDEPFSNLDPMLREDLSQIIVRLKDLKKMGIIYVSHNTGEAILIADRIAVMNQGRIEQIGTVRNVLNHPKTEFVSRFLKTGNR